MLNNFIYAKKKSLFTKELEAGNVLDEAIVFIEDTKEIWNHGLYYGTASIANVEAVDIGEQVDDVVLNYITEDEVYLIVNDAIITTLNTEV